LRNHLLGVAAGCKACSRDHLGDALAGLLRFRLGASAAALIIGRAFAIGTATAESRPLCKNLAVVLVVAARTIVAITAAWPLLPVATATARPVELRTIVTRPVEATRGAVAPAGTILAGACETRPLSVIAILAGLIEASRLAARPIVTAGVIPAPRVARLPRLVVTAITPSKFAVAKILPRSARTTIRRSA
jgi:hypothetical protein